PRGRPRAGVTPEGDASALSRTLACSPARGGPVPKIDEILRKGRSFSFEFFPPRDEKAEAVLAQTLRELEPLHPSYVSVTYGAGGTTRERTHDLVVAINRDTSMTAMAHLACAAHTRAELVHIVTRYGDAAVE